MLFTDKSRSDSTPKRATETEFGFLDRCCWPEMSEVRSLLEICLTNYPRQEQTELIARIRSGDDRHFTSGIFELLLHEYLLRLGFSLTPHPELKNGSPKRPDFLVTCPSGDQVYLEAVCTSENNGDDSSAEARKDVALEALDCSHHSDFFVAVSSTGDPVTQPSGRRLTEAVIDWLNRLDADQVLKDLTSNPEAHPKFQWQHEAWTVRIKAIPVSPKSRGSSRRLIGMRSYGAGWIDGWTPIRNVIVKKTRRYGNLDLPLVIAVNVDTFKLDQIDISQALFGEEQFIFSGESEPQMQRAANGAWHQPSGRRGERCSGAWVFGNLSAYSLTQRRDNLFLNPNAGLQIPTAFLRMPYMSVVDGNLGPVNGITIQDAFELNNQWPR